MHVVTITDKPYSAIDRLARMNIRRWPFKNTILSLHPKRPSPAEIAAVKEALQTTDLLDFQYWKSAMTALQLFPEITERKIPTVLTHQNEHNIIGDWDWKKVQWSQIVCKNGWQKTELEKQGYATKLIKHAIEFDNFTYTDKLTSEKAVLYVGQIKKVKGVRELAQACQELGYRLMIVGKPSEAEYFDQLVKTYGKTIYLLQDVPDHHLGGIYASARVYCANSDDGTESGTMPILEAMAAGVPIVTRNIGLVRDVGEHQKNMWVRKGGYTDIEDLKAGLKMVMENDDVANTLRENAWRSVRQYHPDIQAREYRKLFHKVLYPKDPLVSVIIPTYNRNQELINNLDSLVDQTYKNFEVVVCDDGNDATIEPDQFSFPVTLVETQNYKKPGVVKKYGLAQARNMGVIEAAGEILIFCDDRLQMHRSAIGAFVNALQQKPKEKKVWLWGSKGAFKTFVENFSAIRRGDFIKAGMFNERIDEYGGMGQELSARFSSQGFEFEFCPAALATPLIDTHSRSRRREEIVRSKIKLYKMGFQ